MEDIIKSSLQWDLLDHYQTGNAQAVAFHYVDEDNVKRAYPEGLIISFSENVRIEGNCRKGVRDGIWTMWISIMNWNRFDAYYYNGILLSICPMENSELEQYIKIISECVQDIMEYTRYPGQVVE